jgi:hypothetical protein
LSTDWYSKLVLSVVAICLALLVLQGYRAGGGAGASGSEGDRYRLTVVPMARMVLRFDSETGETWTALFPELRIWTPVADTPAELLDKNAAEAPEAPAPQAPAPEAPAPEAPPPAEGQAKDSGTP